MHIEIGGSEGNQDVKEKHHVDDTIQRIKGQWFQKRRLEGNLERYLEAVINGEDNDEEIPAGFLGGISFNHKPTLFAFFRFLTLFWNVVVAPIWGFENF